MSLHALADHMASRGRGPDTTLVHMAPQEVAGLQALALAHGGSLTINPDTGLPEAGFLKKLLPALAGFALNAFAPGFGSAIGAALGGLSGAAGTAIGLGGITGLATGSLSKGLMAGMGAYGGASLAGGVMGAGVGAAQQGAMGALTQEQIAARMAETGLTEQGVLNQAAAEASKAALASGSAGQTLSSGFGAITSSPDAFGNFAKQNAGSLLAVTSPLLADQGVQTVTKLDNPGYIRNFDYDPMTQRARALNPVSVKSLGYADGGAVGVPKTITQMPGTSPYRDSQAAYEYLMGIAPKAPQQDTQTQTQTQASSAFNPASEGRYAWDSDKKAYTFIPANPIAETTPAPAPASNYNPYDFGGMGGGDSSSSDSSDSSDSGSSSGPGGSSGEAGAAEGGAGPGGPGGDSDGDGGLGGTEGSGNSGGDNGADSSGDGGSGDGGGGDGGGDGGGGDGGGEANGGLMRLYKKFADGGAARVRDGSSEAAYNYLMGLTNSTRPDQYATTMPVTAPVYIPPTVTPTAPVTPVAPTTGGGGVTTLPTTTPTEPTGGITTLPTTPVEPVTPTTPVTPVTPVTPTKPETTTNTIIDDFVPSIRTKPITTTITDDVDRETIPRIIPTTPLDLPDIPTVPDKTGIVEMETATPGVLPAEEVGPRKGGGGDLPEEFDQYLKPDGTTTTTDGGVTVTVPETTTTTPEVTTKTVDTPDGGATVTLPGDGTTVQDDGTTEVIQNEIDNTPVVTQPTVVDTPDGGAEVTLPESTYVPDDVADTFDPDAGSYVEVGDAGGDFGDSGFEQSDDFGKYGLGVSHFGGSGGGGKYLDDLSSGEMFAANGGLMSPGYAMGGGLGSLGGYSDGGRLLRGPGDGVSDSIPATIGNKQPARLADGEFVVPARIVSELGNGSTEAGARKLYKMMDRIQAARGKTVGKGRVAKNSRADKHLPA